jgi:hypothetical protein
MIKRKDNETDAVEALLRNAGAEGDEPKPYKTVHQVVNNEGETITLGFKAGKRVIHLNKRRLLELIGREVNEVVEERATEIAALAINKILAKLKENPHLLDELGG